MQQHWGPGTNIAKVHILGSENHPNNGKERWCCSHHSEASAKGFKLQTQTKLRQKVKTDLTKTNEDESNVAVKDVVAGVKALPKRVSNRLSRGKGKGKKSTFPSAPGTSKQASQEPKNSDDDFM